jgi:hypothetical protein
LMLENEIGFGGNFTKDLRFGGGDFFRGGAFCLGCKRIRTTKK